VFDECLVSRFDLLTTTAPDVLVTPPIFIAFDCLYRDGRDLRAEPLGERRGILERVVAGELVLPCRRLPADGTEAWAEVQQRGLEGLVAKHEASAYRGGPSRSWLKCKVRHVETFLIGGLALGDKARGLLVGEMDGGRLVYRGLVEFGVSAAMLRELARSPLVRDASPFGPWRRRQTVWLEPRLSVEVQYNERTGGRLRGAVLLIPPGRLAPVAGGRGNPSRLPGGCPRRQAT
jgi:bifunctional non-homologous end joining protein LigD